MDGPSTAAQRRRRMSFRAFLVAASSSLLASVGCFPQSTLPLAPANPPPPHVKHEDNEVLRTPKASTCVAFGDFRAKAAAEPHRSPQEQEQMRDQARKAYQQALKIDTSCLEAFIGLARLYQDIGDYPRAVATYQSALQTYPREASLWFDLAMCQARHKDWQATLDSLQSALTVDPENRMYANMMGFCLARAGRYEESLVCFKKIVNEAQAHYNVARMMHHNKDEAGCRRHLQVALQLNPELTPAQQLLSELQGHPPQQQVHTQRQPVPSEPARPASSTTNTAGFDWD